jgi:two-component system phosphate regulon response regulator OmpR
VPEGKHIIVVDDDPEILDAVGEYLTLRRFRVSLAGDGTELHRIMQRDPADLVLLDVGLPGTDGIQLTRQVKSQFACGIIMVTGHGDPEDRVLGLEMGADDYVIKPFNFRELLARINSVLRRVQANGGNQQDSNVVQFGKWQFNTSSRSLQGDDGTVPDLSAGELDILAVLAENANTAVSRHTLLEESSHRDWNPLDRSIDVRITRLRKKLEPNPARPEYIRTARNVGYILRTEAPAN